MKTNKLLEAALVYAGRGWPVLPCQEGRKTPLTWHGFKDATTDSSVIKNWWHRWPSANVAVATGAVSGIIVVDVDGPEGPESFESLGGTSPTPIAATGNGGRHYYLKHPHGRIANFTKRLPGLDLRGDGGYVIAPPSTLGNGKDYYWIIPPGKEEPAEPRRALLDLIAKNGRGPAPKIPGRIVEGVRNDTLTSLAGAMRRRGASEKTILVALTEENERCDPPLDEGELRTIAKSVGRYKPAGGNGAKPQIQPHRTDLGNAQRIVHYHGDDLRYCHLQKCWYVWTGKHWQPDATAEICRRAKDTVKHIYAEASKVEAEDERKEIAKWAMRSESENRIGAMIALAESEPGIPIKPEQLDTDPWLLNCLNGTIDLRTGKLRPHRQEDLITRIAPVEYDQDAKLKLWNNFLEQATGGNQELADFLQRAAGYTLTGDTGEEKLFFVHGPTNSGKSTFIEALKSGMGDYALTSDFETFLARREVGGTRNDIARLAGARFVASIEVDEGKKLAEGLVKMLTGGDTVAARFLYHEAFEFAPSFKLWLAANHAPAIRYEDAAIWRRILRVPFENVIPKTKRDPKIKATLRNPAIAGPAILAWAVTGCLLWQQEGLGIPMAVEKATDDLRADMDPLREFVEECCILQPENGNLWAPSGELYEAYERWATKNGAELLRGNKFTEALKTKGCFFDRRNYRRGWKGIGLLKSEVEK